MPRPNALRRSQAGRNPSRTLIHGYGQRGQRQGGGIDLGNYPAVRQAARRFSADLEKEMKTGLKEAGNIGVDAVKQKLNMIPVQGGTGANRSRSGNLRRSALRATMSRNTRTQVRSKDVRIIEGARGIPGANARGLPRRLNGDSPFQHPVFGHADRVVSQRSWRHFTSVIVTKIPRMTEEMEKVLTRTLEQVARDAGSA